MKPLCLKMQAFGPFARQVELDFRDLKNGGLFLVHGQTGAGKTTLLDGLCFALFGTASGDDRHGEGMRCDLAPPETPTEVTLDFALGAKVYRIIRRPRQELKKLRGTGTRSSEPTAELLEWEDEQASTLKPLASKVSAVNERIRDLLGMDENQFRQVVVLPQGQFRRFLAAGSLERERILETLFRSKRFRDITDNLSKRAEALERELREKRKLMEGQLVSLSAVREEEVLARIEELGLQLQEFQSTKETLEEQYRACERRLQEARNLDRLRNEQNTHLRAQRELIAKKDTIEESRKELLANQKAQPVLSAWRQVSSLKNELSALSEDLQDENTRGETARARLQELNKQLEPLTTQEPEIQAAQTEIQILREHLQKAEKRIASLKAAEEFEQKFGQTKQALEKLDQSQTELKKRQFDLSSNQQNLLSKTQRLDYLQSQRELIRRELLDHSSLVKQAERLSRLRDELKERASLHEQAQEQHARARENLTKMKLLFHLSQAARLALELRTGAPCAVCGSLDHPRPAQLPEEAPGPEEIEEAEKECGAIEAKVQEQRVLLGSLQKEVDSLYGDLHCRLPEEASDTLIAARDQENKTRLRLQEIEHEITATTELSKQIAQLNLQIRETEAQLAAEELRRKNLETERDEVRNSLEARRASVTELESLLPVEHRDPALIIQQGKILREKIDGYQKTLQDLHRQMEETRGHITSAKAKCDTLKSQIDKKQKLFIENEENLTRALLEAGFQTLSDCIASGLPPDRVAAQEKELKAFENSWAVVHSRLTELEVEIQKFKEAPSDVAQAEAEFRAIEEQRTQRLAQITELQTRLNDLQNAREKLREIGQEIATLEEKFRINGRLAKVAAGLPPHNLTGVNLSRYLLATRLDEVLEQASRRLLMMSRGQFSLKRATDREDKRTSAGLDLAVEDSFTGTSRSTASLSGGEGFLASLSLALGLADIVQSHLGGIRLDAVFVDEGFGTLDPEALEQAMRILSQLQAGGRLVGIISHVPELKEQIGRRLFVKRSPSGSELFWESSHS